MLSKEKGLIYVDEIVYSNGAVYRGQVKQITSPELGEEQESEIVGARHGFGVQVWVDGAKYKGMWKENRAHGRGCFWHADGDRFEGDFLGDKSNGQGTYTCLDGTVYSGNWVDDVQHGQGKPNGPTEAASWATTGKARNMEWAATPGLKAISTTESGKTT